MALEEREIQILLSFATDPHSRKAIEAAFDSLEGGFKDAETAAAALDAKYSELLAKIGQVSDPQQRAALTESVEGMGQGGGAALGAAEATGTLNGEFVI